MSNLVATPSENHCTVEAVFSTNMAHGGTVQNGYNLNAFCVLRVPKNAFKRSVHACACNAFKL